MILHAQEHVNHIDFTVVGHYSVLQASEHKFATFASASGQEPPLRAVRFGSIGTRPACTHPNCCCVAYNISYYAGYSCLGEGFQRSDYCAHRSHYLGA